MKRERGRRRRERDIVARESYPLADSGAWWGSKQTPERKCLSGVASSTSREGAFEAPPFEGFVHRFASCKDVVIPERRKSASFRWRLAPANPLALLANSPLFPELSNLRATLSSIVLIIISPESRFRRVVWIEVKLPVQRIRFQGDPPSLSFNFYFFGFRSLRT